MKPDFLENNFLSNEERYPLAKIETNSARALGTNAKGGHIWDNFSRRPTRSFRRSMSLNSTTPLTKRSRSSSTERQDAGPGYYRTASLVSLWSSAPFLHNNMLGNHGDPSVRGGMDAFNDAVEKLLWPEKRLKKASSGGR